jgi:hypothetical protein
MDVIAAAELQRETNIMGSSVQLDFGLEEHMPISAIGARAHLIGLVPLYFGENKLDLT